MYIRWFEDLTSKDVPVVGGKNASLGEIIGELYCERVKTGLPMNHSLVIPAIF
jgi:phosphoenolpyruvate synthase/pyruvate phosphate dikinase